LNGIVGPCDAVGSWRAQVSKLHQTLLLKKIKQMNKLLKC
jgi:hypothetical protein